MSENGSPSFHGVCIAAPGGSCGKTLLSLGLGRALAMRKFIVQPFKKGPDYIDATWLSAACGNVATNLDPFFQDGTGLTQTFISALCRSASAAPQFALVEGNRGLFDGLDKTGSCSTANLARTLKLPVLLCLNAAKTGRTIAAIIKGLLNFETDLKFCGLVLNNVGSARHEKALREVISDYFEIPLLGCLSRFKTNPIPERHMGLRSPAGLFSEEADKIFEKLANQVEANCDIDKLLAMTVSQKPYLESACVNDPLKQTVKLPEKRCPRIGFVRDDALWFYYPENLEALASAGANLVELSLLDPWNFGKWEALDGLYLGGGFPEDYAEAISKSEALKFIAKRAQMGMPVYAECGGLALLGKQLRVKDSSWPMAGIFDISLKLHKAPQGLGYVLASVEEANPFFPKGHILKGHEFHYTICEEFPKNSKVALKLERGQGLTAGKNTLDALIYKNVWASYTHIFAPAETGWATSFVEAAQKWRDSRNSECCQF